MKPLGKPRTLQNRRSARFEQRRLQLRGREGLAADLRSLVRVRQGLVLGAI